MIRKLRELYWYYVKYRKYTPEQKRFLMTFEQGIRARREVEQEIYVLLRLNIERAKLLFENDFTTLKEVEDEIKQLGEEWENEQKELDVWDSEIWRKMFFNFLQTHTNETTAQVWGAPIEDVVKFKEAIAKLAPKK